MADPILVGKRLAVVGACLLLLGFGLCTVALASASSVEGSLVVLVLGGLALVLGAAMASAVWLVRRAARLKGVRRWSVYGALGILSLGVVLLVASSFSRRLGPVPGNVLCVVGLIALLMALAIKDDAEGDAPP